MRDIYTECVVTYVPKNTDRIKGYFFLGLTIVFAVGFLLFGLIPGIIAGVFGFLYYREHQKMSSEYEYVHTNEIFDVDLISGNASRKQVFTTNVQHIALVAPVDAPETTVFRNAQVLDYSGNQKDGLYAMICDKGGQKKKLILQLNKPMLMGLKHWLPGKVIIKED